MKNAKPFKAVIYGLPKTELDVLKATIASLKLDVTDVFKMKTANVDPNNCIYLVHLKRGNYNLASLRNIKSIGNVIVRWAAYVPKFKGPTQCRKCTMYGHGAENCNRRSVCAYCAKGIHESKDCPMNPSTRNGNQNPIGTTFKCYTCDALKLSANHSAFDVNCPARNTYLVTRNKISAPEMRADNVPRNQTAPPRASFPRSATTVQARTYAEQLKQPQQVVGNDEVLFSMPELLNIFQNAVTQLRQCRSKLDQISVIATLLQHAV